jgi:hypothetical protein
MNTLKVIGADIKEISYKRGTYWKNDAGDYYILISLNNGFYAINIRTGSHWSYANCTATDAVDGLSFVGDVEITLKEKA